MSEIDEFVNKYIGIVDKIISKIPYKRVSIWKEFFLNPVATVKKDQVGIGQRMKDIIVSGLIGALIGFVAMIPSLLFGAVASAGAGIIVAGIIPVVMVIAILLSPLIMFVYSLLQLVIAKLLGGTGDMRANFNASALPSLGTMVVMLPLSLISVPLAWLSAIPFVSICLLVVQIPLSIVSALVGLYSLYLGYLAMKEVHKLSTWRAVAVVIVPPLILIGLLVVVFFAIYAMLAMALMSSVSGLSG